MNPDRTAPQRNSAPPRYKFALITWPGAYAVITAILAALGPLMGGWPLVMKTLVISALMVVAMNWLVVPSLTRLFRGWLAPSSRSPARAARRVNSTSGKVATP